MLVPAPLATSLLYGGIVLCSCGFAAFLFMALPVNVAGATIRRAFPHFYMFVTLSAATAAGLVWAHDAVAAGLLAPIAVTTLPARQLLMPAINRATVAGEKARFRWLHGLSVAITLVDIALAGLAMTRFLTMGLT